MLLEEKRPAATQAGHASVPVSAEDPSSGGQSHGLPDELKAGVESLSGFSLDDVKVTAIPPARAA